MCIIGTGASTMKLMNLGFRDRNTKVATEATFFNEGIFSAKSMLVFFFFY